MVHCDAYLIVRALRDVGTDSFNDVFHYFTRYDICHIHLPVGAYNGRVPNQVRDGEGCCATFFLGVMREAEWASFSCEASAGVGYSVTPHAYFDSKQQVAVFTTFCAYAAVDYPFASIRLDAFAGDSQGSFYYNFYDDFPFSFYFFFDGFFYLYDLLYDDFLKLLRRFELFLFELGLELCSGHFLFYLHCRLLLRNFL